MGAPCKWSVLEGKNKNGTQNWVPNEEVKPEEAMLRQRSY